MVRRSILAMFAAMAIVLGGVVVSTPAGAVVDTAVIVPSPNVGTNGNELYSVSCVSVSFCVATGSYSNGNENQTLVEHWDGVSWTVVSSPNVGTNTTELRSVSCVSVSFCVATGSYINGGLTAQTLVEHWNGASWTVVSSPNVGTSFNVLDSVSCVSVSFCVATGIHNGGSPLQTLVEHWDGVSWTVVPSPNVGVFAEPLLSVSCVSVSFCIATGFYQNGSVQQTLVEHWDGVSWTVAPNSNDGTTSVLRSVSCVSATECVAVGFTNTGNANQTLVVSLTGPEPAPSDQVSPAFTG